MNRSVSRSERSTSSELLVVGSMVVFIGVVVTGLALASDDGPGDSPEPALLMFAWAISVVGGAVLLAGLIAKSVALGIEEARQRR